MQLLRYSYKHEPNIVALVRLAVKVVFSSDTGVLRTSSNMLRHELLMAITDIDKDSASSNKSVKPVDDWRNEKED